jgi:citrate lyase subunit beta/citryl-CoA lyase
MIARGHKRHGRSYLFVPGDRPDRFEKARNAGADAIILDLEDAVSNENKSEARVAASEWLSPAHAAYVRINDASSDWFREDLAAVARPGLTGIILPKAENAAQIREVVSAFSAEVRVVPLVETALGTWNARELAEAPGVERLAFGSIDFQRDTGIDGEGEELLYARSRLVLASRVAGILPPLDGVTTALDDFNRLEAEADRARRLGFGGKLCIHPKQIKIVNQAFMPSERDLEWARRVLEAAETAGMGVVQVKGEMIDRPVVERARAIIGRAAR